MSGYENHNTPPQTKKYVGNEWTGVVYTPPQCKIVFQFNWNNNECQMNDKQVLMAYGMPNVAD